MTGTAPREGRRRALHLVSASLGLAAHGGVPHRTMTTILLALLLLALALEAGRRRLPALHDGLARWSGGAFRPAEARGLTGATMLAAGYATTWLLAPAAAAAPALVVAAVADPCAAAVGRWAVPPGGRKTWAGSAGALVAAAVVLALLGAGWRGVLAGSAAAAIAERVPGRGLDNLAVPLATAAALGLLA